MIERFILYERVRRNLDDDTEVSLGSVWTTRGELRSIERWTGRPEIDGMKDRGHRLAEARRHGGHDKAVLRCCLCGLDIKVRLDKLTPFFDLLWASGLNVISLSALAARLSS